MNLYMDIGNSRIKWCADGDKTMRIAQTFEQLQAQWRAFSGAQPRQIIACSVRGKAVYEQVNSLADSVFGTKIRWQHTQSKACGVTNAYPSPKALGVDRWVALIAAHAECKHSACIVIDAGTAITVDLLDARGHHRGGVILPGVSLMLDALGSTAQLKPQRKAGMLDSDALATSTQAAIIAGISFSIQAGLNAVIEQQAAQINVKIDTIPIIMTGGDAPMIQLNTQHLIYKPMLVLDGLKVISECTQ